MELKGWRAWARGGHVLDLGKGSALSLSRNCRQVDTHGTFRFCLRISNFCQQRGLESDAHEGEQTEVGLMLGRFLAR